MLSIPLFHRHEKQTACRKFIDLIYRASSAFPNWDPSRKVEPGDFGDIDRETGQFEKEGNIYTDPVTRDIAKDYPLLDGEVKDSKNIISFNAKHCKNEPSSHVDVAGLAEAYARVRVKFSGQRGAALIIHKPQTKYLNRELIKKIEEDNRCIHLLKRKLMITDVFHAPSYAMYLSERQEENVEIALLADSPDVTAGGGAGAKWWCSAQQGTFEHAHQTSRSFYPLYIHKQLKWKGRRDTPDLDFVDPDGFGFMHSDVPWNPLTEDGDEVKFVPDPEEEDSETEIDLV